MKFFRLLEAAREREFRPLLILSEVWIVAILVIDPRGDFPLNDDWSFGRAVNSLLVSGNMNMADGWASMTLAAQALWGALFCLPFGFSFTALRLSTLSLALGGAVAAYTIARDRGLRKTHAALCAAAILFSPVYFNAAFTFLTDVPFAALTLVCSVYTFRALDANDFKSYRRMLLWLAIATMVRQLAAVLALGFAVAYMLRYRTERKTIFKAALPMLLCGGLLVIHQVALRPLFGFPDLRSPQLKHLAASFLHSPIQACAQMSDDAVIMLLYVGTFLLPLLPLAIIALKRDLAQRTPAPIFAAVAFAGIAFFLLQSGQIMPLARNVLRETGLGPLTLRDTYLLQIPRFGTPPSWAWTIITWLAALTAAIFAGRWCAELLAAVRNLNTLSLRYAIVITISIAGLAYFVMISASGYFDRYLLFYLIPAPLFMLCTEPSASNTPNRLANALSAALLVLVMLFATTATREYLSWNRARWSLLQTLGESAIPPSSIDGGFEFNGMYNYDPHYQRQPDKSWWWVQDDLYILSFGPLSGYRVQERRQFDRILPGQTGEVLLLKRED